MEGGGQPVVRGGNYGVSSLRGSSYVFFFFGAKFSADPDKIKMSLDKSRICFLHAPLFHPAMKNVGPVRKELGIKTFFNMLGPMVNPARPQKQLVGVFSLELARMYGYIYQNMNGRFGIVHALDGYDEISLTGPFKLIDHHREVILVAEALGLDEVRADELRGGHTIAESAEIFQRLLRDEAQPAQKNAVLANAGTALSVARNLPLKEGVSQAKEALENGEAFKAFEKFLETNR
jgi:anthranilate phosphoribosyltransferase